MSKVSDHGEQTASNTRHDGRIKMQGTLRKLKTLRKKYFVLREDTASHSAALEYHKSEKKFLSGGYPKRSIPLNECFDINEKPDNRIVIALYTRDDCFGIVCENDEEQKTWLSALLELKQSCGQTVTRHVYEYVWQVNVRQKGLGTSKHIETGNYRLCLSNHELCWIRSGKTVPTLTVKLEYVRKCGSYGGFFFLEMGRYSLTGAGELWMLVSDPNVAQLMHEIIIKAMSRSRHRPVRTRSARPQSPSYNDESISYDSGPSSTPDGTPNSHSFTNSVEHQAMESLLAHTSISSSPSASTDSAQDCEYIMDVQGNLSSFTERLGHLPMHLTASDAYTHNKRCNSVGSRPQHPLDLPYLDMTGKQNRSYNKSSSAPHLPDQIRNKSLSRIVRTPITDDLGPESRLRLGSLGEDCSNKFNLSRHTSINHGQRPRTVECMRPRTSSLGVHDMRPRSSSYGQAHYQRRGSQLSRAEIIAQSTSEYLDMSTQSDQTDNDEYISFGCSVPDAAIHNFNLEKVTSPIIDEDSSSICVGRVGPKG